VRVLRPTHTCHHSSLTDSPDPRRRAEQGGETNKSTGKLEELYEEGRRVSYLSLQESSQLEDLLVPLHSGLLQSHLTGEMRERDRIRDVGFGDIFGADSLKVVREGSDELSVVEDLRSCLGSLLSQLLSLVGWSEPASSQLGTREGREKRGVDGVSTITVRFPITPFLSAVVSAL
jgi:hypothetical protein